MAVSLGMNVKRDFLRRVHSFSLGKDTAGQLSLLDFPGICTSVSEVKHLGERKAKLKNEELFLNVLAGHLCFQPEGGQISSSPAQIEGHWLKLLHLLQ